MQNNVRLRDYKFSDLRNFSDLEWSRLRSTLLRILFWLVRNDNSVQFSDVEDFAHELLLKLWMNSRPTVTNGRRDATRLDGYVFKSARNRHIGYLRARGRRRVILAGDHGIDLSSRETSISDLGWVTDALIALRPEDLDLLEEHIFRSEKILEVAGGDKMLANRLYKRGFDARRKLRTALERTIKELGIHLRSEDGSLDSKKAA